jgi:hypothetical protein
MTPLPPRRRSRTEAADATSHRGRFTLVPERAGFRHRGVDLSAVVEGLGELGLEDGVRMNPDDLARLGVEPGGLVTIWLDGEPVPSAVRTDPGCPRGAVYATRVAAWGGLGPATRLEALSRLPARPFRVRVSAGDPSGKDAEGGRRGTRR